MLKEQGERSSNKILYLISLNHATNDASVALLPTLFPIILALFKISLFDLGILVAAMYLTNVVCQPITGQYSERFEPRVLLPLGMGLMAVSMIFLIFSQDFETLLISAVVLRIGSSFFHPVGISMISRSYTGEALDRSMGFQSAFGNFGIFIVFLVAAPLYFEFGWSFPFLIFAAIEAAVMIVTLARLGKVHSAANSQKFERKFLVALPSFFLASTFISGGSNAVIINYGNVLLEQNNFSVPDANLMIAGWIALAFFGAFFTGALTRRYTRKKLLISMYVISAISILTFGLLPGNIFISVLSLFANGFSTAITYPAIYSELSSFLGSRSQEKGAAFGMIFSSQIIGAAVMGFFAGSISGIFGLNFPFVITSLLLIVAAGVSFFWTGRGDNPNISSKIL